MNRAVFLDRDGTLNKEVNYLHSANDLELLPGSASAVKILNEAGFKVIIITNQSGIARGILDETDLKNIHEKLISLLETEGARIDGIYYCPHHPTEGTGKYTKICDCRKPLAGLFIQAAEEFDIDLKSSFFVGDKLADIRMAPVRGGKSILVKTGYGLSEMELLKSDHESFKPDYIAENLLAAAGLIIELTKGE
ncbi:MAG: D-glycero-beta-D-manno-heptose 1,7-bisphosphate 7-phosphatase [Acidobacteria bacterium]|nr:D-glycero-beta-D-manno-heptose 1,7-bisphosphate 7-phosphatase [Acidobacteriota bacterium]